LDSIVVLSDDENEAGILSKQNQSCQTESLLDCRDADASLRKYHADHGIHLNFESLSDGSGSSEIQDRRGFLSDGTKSFIAQNSLVSDLCTFSSHCGTVSHSIPSQQKPLYSEGICNLQHSSPEQNRVSGIDLFEHKHPAASSRICDSGVSTDSKSGYLETQGKGQSFAEHNSLDTLFDQDTHPRTFISDRELFSNCEFARTRSKHFADCDRQDFLSNETGVQQTSWVQEQKSPATDLQEHFNDHHLGLGIEFRHPKPKCSEKCLLYFSEDDQSQEFQSTPTLEKLWLDDKPLASKMSETSLPAHLFSSAKKHSFSDASCGFPVDKSVWPDEERSMRKRFRTSLSANYPHRSEKSSSSVAACGLTVHEEPLAPERFGTSLPAKHTVAVKKFLSSDVPSGLPVEKSVCAMECVYPKSSIVSSRSVSMVDSHDGLHVITEEIEETVAHTICDDPTMDSDVRKSRNLAKSRASCNHSTDDGRSNRGNSANLSVNWCAGSAREGLDSKRPDGIIREIVFSPSSESVAVVCRAPSKTSSSYSLGGRDRRDIAGGWIPVCGQTVVRRQPKHCEGSARKLQPPSHDSLWTTFDDKKSGGTSAQPVHSQDRFGGVATKGQETISAQPSSLSTSKSGVSGKCDKLMKNYVESAASMSSLDPPHILLDGWPCVAETGSSGERDVLATVQNLERKRTTGNGSSGNTDGVDLSSQNTYSRVITGRFEAENSSGDRSEAFRVQNVDRKGSLEKCEDGFPDMSSKWDKFRETLSSHPCQTIASSLVRTTSQTQQPWTQTSNLVTVNAAMPSVVPTTSEYHGPQTTKLNLARIQSSASSSLLGTSTEQSHFQPEAQKPSRKPEVACVTPQVRLPLRSLHLEHDTSNNNPGQGMCYIFKAHFYVAVNGKDDLCSCTVNVFFVVPFRLCKL